MHAELFKEKHAKICNYFKWINKVDFWCIEDG